jgi:hypothetical protein
MQKDEINVLKARLKKREEELKTAEEKGDSKAVEFLISEAALLNAEILYIKSGGKVLKAPDDPAQLEFLLKEKKTILKEFESKINLSFFQSPEEQIKLENYRKIERILKAQCEYLTAKHTIITEDRHLTELRRWIKLTEDEGVEIVASTLEHEAEIESFRPSKKEKEKKEFVIEFRKVALAMAVVFIILAVYFGTYWRKTPYDRGIIRDYVVARNHYLTANDYYVTGDYENSKKEYAIAAAFFNRAENGAGLAAKSRRGKMRLYFENKKMFFEQWELIGLNMIKSSEEFQSGDPDVGTEYVVEAVGMAELAGRYNREAEEAWRLL